VSILLVIVAQAILTSDTLPVTRERLWINVLTQGSQYFSILVVVESVFVAYLRYGKTEGSDEKETKTKNRNSSSIETEENIEESESFLDNQNDNSNSVSGKNKWGPDSSNDKEGSLLSNKTAPQQITGTTEKSGDRDSYNDKEVSLLSKVKQIQWTAKKIRSLDRWCFVLFLCSYLLFIIVLFAVLNIFD